MFSYVPIITYSDIEGGNPGIGNINSNPLFADPANDNYTLQLGSPAIDAGHPDLDGDGSDYTTDTDDQDPDGTRMDMGAFPSSYGLPPNYSTIYAVSYTHLTLPTKA